LCLGEKSPVSKQVPGPADPQSEYPQANGEVWWQSSLSWLRSILWLYVKALPLLLLWLALPAFVYWLSLNYQAGTPARELPSQTFVQATQVISDAQGDLTLVIAHPLSLLLDAPDRSRRPVAIWLLRATPTPGPSPTPRPAEPSPPPEKMVGTATPITTPIPNPYIVAFESASSAVEFTDKDGLPVLSKVALTPAPLPGTPAVLHLQPAQTTPGPLPQQVGLKAYVDGPDNTRLNAATPLDTSIGLESESGSCWRRFWELIGGVSVVVVTLAGALLGFAVQQWKQIADEEQRARQFREAAFAEIESLKSLISRAPAEAARRYQEYQERTAYSWRDPQIRARLEAVWQSSAPQELRHGLELLRAYERDKEKWTAKLESLGSGVALTSLLWSYKNLNEDFQKTVASMLSDLCQEKYIQVVNHYIATDRQSRHLLRMGACKERLQQFRDNPKASQEAREVAKSLLRLPLRPSPSVLLWTDYRLPDLPDVAAGMRLLGLCDNPFGPELAELDPLLPEYWACPSVLESARGPRPVLVLGAPGSGKTAAALLLAYDCTYPPASPRESGAFPVYHTPRLDVSPDKARRVQLDALARAVAQALANYLASDLYAFLEHEEASRVAIVQLLATYADLTGNLAWQLQRAGLAAEGTAAQILRQMKEIERRAGGIVSDSSSHERVLIDLLGKARPAGLAYTYALIDLAVEPLSEEAIAFASRVRPLFDLTVPLARVGVYLKAFLPEKLFRERDKSWKSEHPDTGAIRELLTSAFSDEELQFFCHDQPDFRSVYEEFSSGMSKSEKIERLIAFSEQHALLDKLLNEVQKANPRQYASFQNRLYRVTIREPATPGSEPSYIAYIDSWGGVSLLQPVLLAWSQADLEELLVNRLRWVGYQSLGSLCDPEARMLAPDERLVRAAQGVPRRLIQLGNQLLARVATHPDEPRLTAADLDAVLGSA
jgi:hypothetical protein